jgi:ribosomal protein L37AE/L43A
MSQSADLKKTMDLIAAGRTSNLECPFCKGDILKKGNGDYGPVFTCPKCRKFIEAPMDDF